jgi:hypothetical protein
LGWLRPIAPLAGDPRLGMTGIFLQLSRVLPDEYPLDGTVDSYLAAELGFGRVLDFGLIQPRLTELYGWSANQLGAPELMGCERDGALTYAWSEVDQAVWRRKQTAVVAAVRRALPPTRTLPTRPAVE